MGKRSNSTWIRPEVHQYWIQEFIKTFGVNTSELLKQPSEFKTIGEFFTRKIKPRSVELNENAILSPADCEVLSVTKVENDYVSVIKRRNYNLGELLNGDAKPMTADEINSIKLDPSNSLYSVVFHLRMGDYHHVHSPMKFHINRYNYIKGDRRDHTTLWARPYSIVF